ncbi:hypothetical protein WJX84_005079, partial [Apatococcus fuscideae]
MPQIRLPGAPSIERHSVPLARAQRCLSGRSASATYASSKSSGSNRLAKAREIKEKQRLLLEEATRLALEVESDEELAELDSIFNSPLPTDATHRVQDGAVGSASIPEGYGALSQAAMDMLHEAGVDETFSAEGLPSPSFPGTYFHPPGHIWDWSKDELVSDPAEAMPDSPADVEGDSPDGRLERWLEANASQPDPEAELPFGEDEATPGDDEPFTTSPAHEFPADVVEVLEMLEGGGTLPAEEHGRQPEDGAAFVARMDKLVARYEAQFLKKSQQKISSEEIKELDSNGWRSQSPISFDDITEVIPAPTIPAEAEAKHERLQWILLKLRRAHMSGKVDAALRSLATDDLIAHSVTYEDPIATSDDLPDLLQCHTTLSQAGVEVELEDIWAAMDTHSDPAWSVVIQQYLHIPYPDWFLEQKALEQQQEPAVDPDWVPLEPEEEERLTELLTRVQVPQQQMAAQDAADRRDLLRRAAYHVHLSMSVATLQ